MRYRVSAEKRPALHNAFTECHMQALSATQNAKNKQLFANIPVDSRLRAQFAVSSHFFQAHALQVSRKLILSYFKLFQDI